MNVFKGLGICLTLTHVLTGRLTSHKADLIYISQQLGNDSRMGKWGDREQKTHPHTTAHLIYIPQPLGNVFKGLGICDVVDEHDAHGSTVVGGGDGVEALLTSSVPETAMLITQQQTKHNNKNAHTHKQQQTYTQTTNKTYTHTQQHAHNNKHTHIRTQQEQQNAQQPN